MIGCDLGEECATDDEVDGTIFNYELECLVANRNKRKEKVYMDTRDAKYLDTSEGTQSDHEIISRYQ